MIHKKQRDPAKNVFAKTEEITPRKLVEILSQLCERNSYRFSSSKRVEAVCCITIGLRSCKTYSDDKIIIQSCLALEPHFRTIATTRSAAAHQNYHIKITSIMNACRSFLNTQQV